MVVLLVKYATALSTYSLRIAPSTSFQMHHTSSRQQETVWEAQVLVLVRGNNSEIISNKVWNNSLQTFSFLQAVFKYQDFIEIDSLQ